MAKTKATTNKAAEFINTDKIRWISIGKITVDPEIKAIFNQNETEILNISEDMKVNGYNAGNPATVSQDNVLVEGHTRFIAAQRAGLKKIAVVTKHFNSKQEMLEYAYKQQLHRRNLSEQDIFNAYKKLRELTNPDGKKAKTDVEIAEELHVSPR
ncbi:MAG: ParB N-terminal domain-containing protein, partial [Treponema sp.]|nr:ParB N-terminal domain-containing protein [Treponema sp.]